jgi:DNA-binding response OmpR family regulator
MSERVLIADDDPDILAVVQVNFELEGFEVETAVDGEDALQKATANPPHVIVLDIMMPRMDGLTALHRLRSQASTGNIPIILLTARGLPEDRVRGLELGADDYITKPFDINELVARVRAVVRRTQAARDLSPLTGLPGNFKITGEVEERISTGRDFALVHGDLDNFKAFNDHYGFMRGDEVIRFCAKCFNTSWRSSPLRCPSPSARRSSRGSTTASSTSMTPPMPFAATSRSSIAVASVSPSRWSPCRWV